MKWISVKDALPEETEAGEPIIGCTERGWVGEMGFKWGKFWQNYKDVTNIVTHWMPLPEPPTL